MAKKTTKIAGYAPHSVYCREDAGLPLGQDVKEWHQVRCTGHSNDGMLDVVSSHLLSGTNAHTGVAMASCCHSAQTLRVFQESATDHLLSEAVGFAGDVRFIRGSTADYHSCGFLRGIPYLLR